MFTCDNPFMHDRYQFVKCIQRSTPMREGKFHVTRLDMWMVTKSRVCQFHGKYKRHMLGNVSCQHISSTLIGFESVAWGFGCGFHPWRVTRSRGNPCELAGIDSLVVDIIRSVTSGFRFHIRNRKCDHVGFQAHLIQFSIKLDCLRKKWPPFLLENELSYVECKFLGHCLLSSSYF